MWKQKYTIIKSCIPKQTSNQNQWLESFHILHIHRGSTPVFHQPKNIHPQSWNCWKTNRWWRQLQTSKNTAIPQYPISLSFVVFYKITVWNSEFYSYVYDVMETTFCQFLQNNTNNALILTDWDMHKWHTWPGDFVHLHTLLAGKKK